MSSLLALLFFEKIKKLSVTDVDKKCCPQNSKLSLQLFILYWTPYLILEVYRLYEILFSLSLLIDLANLFNSPQASKDPMSWLGIFLRRKFASRQFLQCGGPYRVSVSNLCLDIGPLEANLHSTVFKLSPALFQPL